MHCGIYAKGHRAATRTIKKIVMSNDGREEYIEMTTGGLNHYFHKKSTLS